MTKTTVPWCSGGLSGGGARPVTAAAGRKTEEDGAGRRSVGTGAAGCGTDRETAGTGTAGCGTDSGFAAAGAADGES
ncbi:MAG: hypothetical protein LBP23_03100 [Treponema sp.]|nr:hypothetical protein [Treponema sp.]